MAEPAVLIVGAGPVGLSLALGLARHGVRSRLVEREASTSERSKAPGIQARTLEIFGQWGIAEEVVRTGIFLRTATVHEGESNEPMVTVPVAELDEECRYAGICLLEQGTTERILLDAVRASGLCEVCFEHELLRFEPDGSGMRAVVRHAGGEQSWRARFLVGCDGAGSRVRELLELPFEGHTYPMDAILADVRFDDARAELPFPRVAALGDRLVLGLRLESGNWRVVGGVRAEAEAVDPEEPVAREEIAPLVERVWGPGGFECVWSSRFRVHRRSAPRFRVGRVLLAGDAAHVNSPVGAQGMNAGIQDAHNLAWKLAAALAGGDEERLLESYHAERHDLIEREINPTTDRISRLILAPAPLRALGARLTEAAFRVRRIRRPLMRRLAMLASRYRDSPLLEAGGAVGRRMPDVELEAAPGRQRIHQLMGVRPAALFLDHPPLALDAALGLETVVVGEGAWRDPSGLLVRRFGAPRVLIVRPDHYVGWAGEPADAGELARAARMALGAGEGSGSKPG